MESKVFANSSAEPAVSYSTTIESFESGYIGTVVIPDGKVLFFASEITYSRQSIEAVLEIEVQNKKEKLPAFSQRIDLRSASALKNLTTELNSAYGGRRDRDGYNWSLILNTFIASLSHTLKESQKPHFATDIGFEEPAFLLRPFLQHGASNLIFAQSEVGKSWFALRLALSLATGKEFFGYESPAGKKTLYLDYEDSLNAYASRLHKLCRGMNVDYHEAAQFLPYYNPQGSFKDNIEIIKKMVAKEHIDLIIIDAGGDATGGSPSDEQKVLEFFNALGEIPTTKLILHHEPKYVLSENAAFYGSMYWKARSRIGWRLETESQEGLVSLVKASIQKRSNLPYLEPFFYKISYDALALEDFGSTNLVPAVILEKTDAQEVQSKDMLSVLSENGTLTASQLAEMTGKDRSSVWRQIRSMKDTVEIIKNGKSIAYRLKRQKGEKIESSK